MTSKEVSNKWREILKTKRYLSQEEIEELLSDIENSSSKCKHPTGMKAEVDGTVYCRLCLKEIH